MVESWFQDYKNHPEKSLYEICEDIGMENITIGGISIYQNIPLNKSLEGRYGKWANNMGNKMQGAYRYTRDRLQNFKDNHNKRMQNDVTRKDEIPDKITEVVKFGLSIQPH